MAIPLTLPQYASITSNSLTLARTWDMIRRDGQALYMTGHDRPLSLGGKVYMPVKTIAATAVTQGGGFTARDKELKGAIDTELIRSEDLHAGLYKDAFIRESVVDWSDIGKGQFLTSVYWWRKTKFDGQLWTAEVEGFSGWAGKAFGRNYTRDCVYNLGDRNCRADTSAYEISGTVSGLTQYEGEDDPYNATFVANDVTASPGDIYRTNGVLVFTSGENAGLAYTVRTQANATKKIELWLELIFPVAVGDEFDLYPGCQKTPEDCKTKYDNFVNYGGFPFLVSNDFYIRTPDGK